MQNPFSDDKLIGPRRKLHHDQKEKQKNRHIKIPLACFRQIAKNSIKIKTGKLHKKPKNHWSLASAYHNGAGTAPVLEITQGRLQAKAPSSPGSPVSDARGSNCKDFAKKLVIHKGGFPPATGPGFPWAPEGHRQQDQVPPAAGLRIPEHGALQPRDHGRPFGEVSFRWRNRFAAGFVFRVRRGSGRAVPLSQSVHVGDFIGKARQVSSKL